MNPGTRPGFSFGCSPRAGAARRVPSSVGRGPPRPSLRSSPRPASFRTVHAAGNGYARSGSREKGEALRVPAPVGAEPRSKPAKRTHRAQAARWRGACAAARFAALAFVRFRAPGPPRAGRGVSGRQGAGAIMGLSLPGAPAGTTEPPPALHAAGVPTNRAIRPHRPARHHLPRSRHPRLPRGAPAAPPGQTEPRRLAACVPPCVHKPPKPRQGVSERRICTGFESRRPRSKESPQKCGFFR